MPPDRLLIHRIGDGWAPLCRFLGKPVPAIPYPHSNSAAEFNATHSAAQMEQTRPRSR